MSGRRPRIRHRITSYNVCYTKLLRLSQELDCGFICGDGSRPAILREADPQHTTVLYCLTGDDKSNMIASLVGRSLGFGRIVTKIDDPELEHICLELGLV